jgi:hypothetical protein
VSALTGNASPDGIAPTGASFGFAGAYTGTLIGPLVAGLEANLTVTTIGLNVHNVVIGSTDGTATGTFSYSKTFTPVTANGRQLAGVSWTTGTSTLNGNFVAGDVGFAVAQALGGTGIPTGTTITAVNPGVSATIDTTTTTTGSGTLGLGGQMSFTDAGVSTGNVFTTNGVNGGHANIGVIGADGFDVVGPLTLTFGGTDGVGATNCLLTGWGAGPTPGPAQTGQTTPQTPPGSTTQLVAASGGFIAQPGTSQQITPPAAAFVILSATPPTANNQTVAVGQGVPAPITLTATAGSYPVDPNSFSLVGGSPQTIGSLTITQVGGTAVINTTNTAAAPETDTFQFNVCDTLAAGHGGPVCSAAPGTITVKIGTPPVVQPFTEQVTGGLLVISCDSPANYITPAGQNQSPAPTGSNPLQQCPEFQMPPITLDGLEQTVSGTTGNTGGNPSGSNPGTIYISDNRGSPMDQWTLSASLIPTASNPNPTCAGVVAFCNGDPSINALHAATNGALDAQIAPNYLQVGNIACTADATGGTGTPPYNPPNLNPDATPTTGGNFGSTVALCSASQGQSGGTFLYNATYTLTIPESVYAGDYFGSIQYTIG